MLIYACGYRSPLAGVIQPQDVKELCSLLVIVSKEAAKTFAGNFQVHGFLGH